MACMFGSPSLAFFGAAIQGRMQASSVQLSKGSTRTGTRVGTVFTLLSVAVLTGPPNAGALIPVMGGAFLGAELWGGSCLVVGAILLGAAAWLLNKSN